ncbi:MAG: sodium:proton antiporter, partial [Burkholderiaceae bacterium]|nr:sodium:proton antiporter [Burkholderiaceae bacterium]
QILAAVVLGGAVALFWGWSIEAALVFGLSLSVASTVVLLKALESRGILDSANGRIAVGWLVVEDLVMVLVLVLLPVAHEFLSDASGNAASLSDIGQSIAVTLTKVTAFIVLMLIVGKRVLPKTLWLVAKSGSRELFTLSVVAIAIGVAFGAAKLFDVSFALGAFFAGMMMRESEFSHRAADESLPLRDAFAVLFFVSVGMLFDPQILINEPLKLLIVVAIIMIGKTIAAIALVLAFRYPLNTAMTVGASLAQIGEFSFILAGMGLAMNMLPAEGYSLILAGALISIAANSLTFYTISPAIEWAKKNSEFARKLDLRDDPLAQLPMSTHHDLLNGQVVVVGYGRVGRHIATRLQAENISVVIAEQSREVVENLRKNNQPAVCGDSDPAVLIQAHIARAAFLIIAVKDAVGIPQMVETARTLNPSIQILIRANTDE